jgi:hypothetical protein
MTMWRPTEPAEEDVSDVPGIDLQYKRRRSRRRALRDGLADQTVVQNLEHVRSYRAFERDLIGSVDPRSVIELELVHRLASLLWRLRRAGAIETGLFEQGELLPARRQRRLEAISAKGDPLETIKKIVPWEDFRAGIEALTEQARAAQEQRRPQAL